MNFEEWLKTIDDKKDWQKLARERGMAGINKIVNDRIDSGARLDLTYIYKLFNGASHPWNDGASIEMK